MLPALTNQFVNTIKDSSLIFVLGLGVDQREIYRIGRDYALRTGNLSPLTMVGIAYLTFTVPLTYLRQLSRPSSEGRPTPRRRRPSSEEIVVNAPAISLRGVNVAFHGHPALRSIDTRASPPARWCASSAPRAPASRPCCAA